MPIIYYTEKEHKEELAKMYNKAMNLAQALCKVEDFPCILPWNNRREYCLECPAEKNCPYEDKLYKR